MSLCGTRMSNEQYNILYRKMTQNDVEEVVSVHIHSFKDFFLTFLGSRFLRVLYSYIVSEKFGIAIVAEVSGENKLVGFVAGTMQPYRFYSKAIHKKAIPFAIATIPAFVRRPSILVRLFRVFQKPRQAKKDSFDCELMSIAVLPEFRSCGIGWVLEQEFCNQAQLLGAKSIMLTTDRENNEKVNKFYLRKGYQLYDHYVTPERRQMNKYVKYIG